MNHSKVIVVILNWNGFQDTSECVDSLRKVIYPDYEIVVVDNASCGDEAQRLRDKYGAHIHVIENDKNLLFAEGCNIGIRYALSRNGSYILLLNNDTVVDPKFIAEMVKVAESSDDIGVVGSKVFYYQHPDVLQSAGGKIRLCLFAIDYFGDVKDAGQFDNVADRDFVSGMSFMIKRSLIENIGLLDPYYLFGYEDIDYCLRVKHAGYRTVYVPRSIVWHKAGSSLARLKDFPETGGLIAKSKGFRDIKYRYHLLRKNLPAVLFLFPLILDISLIGPLLILIGKRDWTGIKRVLFSRLGILKKTAF